MVKLEIVEDQVSKQRNTGKIQTIIVDSMKNEKFLKNNTGLPMCSLFMVVKGCHEIVKIIKKLSH